jgi:arylsulfatase A-like enzyme
VLLITIDALRPHHLGCYGYHRKTSPRIDALAQEGALFKNVIAQAPWSLPSITSIMTSLYPSTHKVVQQNNKLGPSVKPLAQILGEHGYVTGAFTGVSGFCGAFYHNRGFDIYHDSWKTAPQLTQIAVQWLNHVKDSNFFAFIHYFDVHSDYNPPPPYNTMYDADYTGIFDGTTETLDKIFKKELTPTQRDIEHITALYDGGITYTDDFLGQLFEQIDALGLRDNTVIIISADHGEELYEHGATVHRQLYEETIKIPLIMRLPGRIPSGTIRTRQVRSIDIMPTILDILNITIDQKMQGISLLPIIDNKDRRNHLAICETEKYGGFRALRIDNEWKLIHNMHKKTSELYNLNNDPNETHDLAPTEVAKTKELEKVLFEHMEKINTFLPVTSEEVEVTPELQERLRSLGYAQ